MSYDFYQQFSFLEKQLKMGHRDDIQSWYFYLNCANGTC